MAFKDYSTTPASNTSLGDGSYIGPNMLRNKVRPALQQLAADGKSLADEVQARVLLGKGDPGGSPEAIGLFATAATHRGGLGFNIPVGVDVIATSGYSGLDKGAALYVYDAAVNSAYVTANPSSSFLSNNGRGFRLSMDQVLTPQMFGAVADGVTNDRAAFAAAVATARGKRLSLPRGNYLVNSDGGSITLEEIDLIGECVLDGATGSIDEGAMLWITGTTTSPFKVRRGVSIEGLGFYYPNQTDSATPTTYAPTLDFDYTAGAIQFVTISRNVVYNAWNFIRGLDSGGNIGHVEITNNYICALSIGILLKHNAEHFRIRGNNFTFGHWLAATEAGAAAYMRANGIAIKSDRSDGLEITDNLFFGSLRGIMLSEVGLCQFMNIAHNKFDQVRYGIHAIGAGNFGGIICGNNFQSFNSTNTALQGRSISIETQGTARETITIASNNFLLATEEHIFTTSTANRQIVIGAQSYRSWGSYKSSGTYGAMWLNGASTSVSVSGGWFEGGSAYQYGIRGSFSTLQVTGATFNLCQQVLDISTVTTQLTGNRSFGTIGATGLNVIGTLTSTGNAWDKP